MVFELQLLKAASYLVCDVQVQIKPTRREEKCSGYPVSGRIQEVRIFFRNVFNKLSIRRVKLELILIFDVNGFFALKS
jgi:hypothetical protein